MTISKVDIQNAINKCIAYFKNNRGSSKPNACNLEGIPYHAYNPPYHWQIAPHSTTSECLALFLRALIMCDEIEYAEFIAKYIINKLTHNDIDTVHWLVNLSNTAVEMETVFCGNYDNAVFSFTDGIAVIPAGSPWFGDRLLKYYDSRYSGIRACFSTDAEFPWKDYWIENKTGIKYEVESYKKLGDYLTDEQGNFITTDQGEQILVSCTGTEVTLVDKTVNTDLQVFYAYRNQEVLNKDELYRTYPLNTNCIITPDIDFQISSATDGIQWAIVALKELGGKTGKQVYTDYAEALKTKLIADMTIKTNDFYIFDATNRGLSWFGVSIYDENGNRNVALSEQDKNHTRYNFDAGTGAISWSIGNSFEWLSSNFEFKTRGDGSGSLRQFVINDGTKDYYSPWMDSSISDKDFTKPKTDFCSIDNIFLEAARLPYLATYSYSWGGASASYSIVDFDSSFTDSQGVSYALWHKFSFSGNGTGSGFGFGSGHISDVVTQAGDILRIILNSDSARNVYFKIKDANNNEQSVLASLVNGTAEYDLDLDNDFVSVPVHPVQNFEIWMQDNNDSGNIHIATVIINNHNIFSDTNVEALKFETRQTTSGYFDVSYARIQDGNDDAYAYAGVPLFTLEYSELGLMGWRAGSYTGYTNPYIWLGSNNNLDVSLKFLYDAQIEYEKRFGKKGPFIPVYLRNLGENSVYGNIAEWTWQGADPNTNWAGFQYRALANVADTYLVKHNLTASQIGYCTQILNKWASFLYFWLKTNPDIPSDFNSNGSIQTNYISPDFYALIGRAMLIKSVQDNDPRAIYILEQIYGKLIALQSSANGSFASTEIYNFHQAESLMFLAQFKDYVDSLYTSTTLSLFEFKPKVAYTTAIEFRTKIFESFLGKEQRQSQTKYPIRTWKLEFEKNPTEKLAMQNFFNSLSGKYGQFGWIWEESMGGDGNFYVCRLLEDIIDFYHDKKGYGRFSLSFFGIDTNGHSTENYTFEGYGPRYKGKIEHKTVIDKLITANVKTYKQWHRGKKSWTLELQKNKEALKKLENFFKACKGRFKAFDFVWAKNMGGDDNTYRVRFDTDILNFETNIKGYGKITVPIVEVL